MRFMLDADRFQYSTGLAIDAPSGTPTVRLTTSPRAYATIAGHGLGPAGTAVNPFIVAGANPAGYNGTFASGRVEDANTISYVLTAAVGNNTATGVTGSWNSRTAVGTSASHGFIPTQIVTISGASPNVFNGAVTILTTPTVDTFTYAIASPAGNASGAINAISSGAGASERTKVINWVRGEDNYEDENSNSSFVGTRASMHGDVLESQRYGVPPPVINRLAPRD